MTYIGNRGDDLEMRHLKVNFELGRSRFVFYSPKDVDSIREVIADADVVVNMAGKYHETGKPVAKSSFPYIKYQPNWTLYDTNVTLARTLAEVCKEMQVDHLVHVSSASASPTAKSEWSRTKYEGELAVKEAFPWATIIRPTQLFGRMDRLLNWFARMQTYYLMVPLVNGGKALTQPVWVGDVAKTILRVCDDPAKFEGREIDCFGPADYTYEELASFVNSITDRNVTTFDLPANYFKSLANILQWQRNPLLTPDLVDLWSENFLPRMDPEEYKKQAKDSTKILTMEDLGIKALPIEKEAFGYLHAYRFGGHFFRTHGYHT
jgi:NADH dehydrogenase (ubiquinone) 1 alpha subcomplex subunit 9